MSTTPNMADVPTRICWRCSQPRWDADFVGRRGGYESGGDHIRKSKKAVCNPCIKASRQRRESDPRWKERRRREARERARKDPARYFTDNKRYALKRLYGVSLDRYEAQLKEQDGRCAICRVHEDDLSKKLCVDHDHVTGAIRGLLCDSCNRGIGFLRDSTDTLKAALLYLEGFSKRDEK